MDYSTLLIIMLGCPLAAALLIAVLPSRSVPQGIYAVSYTHLRAHETLMNLG